MSKGGKILYYVFKYIGYTWLGLASFIIVVGLLWSWKTEGFARVQYLLSPLNFWNYGIMLLTLAPGLVLLWLSDKFESS